MYNLPILLPFPFVEPNAQASRILPIYSLKGGMRYCEQLEKNVASGQTRKDLRKRGKGKRDNADKQTTKERKMRSEFWLHLVGKKEFITKIEDQTVRTPRSA
jgi:hypothetical protein